MKGRAKQPTHAKVVAADYRDAAWVQTINRLLRVEMREDPRPKPGHPAKLKYWNQTDLAIAADIRGNTLSDILLGKRKPELDSLEAVARALRQPTFLFLMDSEEAERYARFRVAANAEDITSASRARAHEIVAELAPEIAELIERRLTGQSAATPDKALPGTPVLATRSKRKHAS